MAEKLKVIMCRDTVTFEKKVDEFLTDNAWNYVDYKVTAVGTGIILTAFIHYEEAVQQGAYVEITGGNVDDR